MLDAFDVGGPNEILGIKRTGNAESAIGPMTRSLQHQPIERRLPIVAVCSEVSHVPRFGLRFRIILVASTEQ